MIIKLLLLAALGGAAFFLMRGRVSALSLLMRRSVTLLAIALGAGAVLFPAAVTEVANLVGVGRGTDLVVYVLAICFMFVSISLYTRLASVQDRQVQLIRRLALLEASVEGSPVETESR